MSKYSRKSSRRGVQTVKRNGKRYMAKNQNANRSHGDRLLAPGVGAITRRPFGNRASGAPRLSSVDLGCWDAKLPMHLPLPRPVGPYLTMRLTKRFSSSDAMLIFGTFQKYESGPGEQHWSNICCISSYSEGTAVGGANNARFHCFGSGGLGANCTWVPSAMTVQVMNPGSISATSGVMYAGVSQTQLPIGGASATWNTVADDFIQFQRPRLLAAGKLALRGVQASSYPLNMSEVSDFTKITKSTSDGVGTWSGETTPVGFAPICFVNAGATSEAGVNVRAPMEFLVTTEYRVRFDFSHPASAAHVQHPIASDATWNALMTKAVSLGHGVMDIADMVANVGSLLRNSGATVSI